MAVGLSIIRSISIFLHLPLNYCTVFEQTTAALFSTFYVHQKKFDISFISSLALREKQIQQNYRPIIAVHKWFARRPGTLFRGLSSGDA
ncbi:MAG: hypothetical protein A2X56_02625 [Nitrospirae bacterium GWC2_57_13]|nr:MAG: hypothetical protein A2072_02030 [Nitrospirae bacterium GWC1_57_7]OGW28593.1 MAG: hypothetical protein A2X56_02625 [Nitrospirae bacterium GWC2_57_13]OGW43991.1 MAG: hypothetical protein A2X57_10135 [Nitrospirae bacterium GWD2_57_8]HAS53308.1 hypothetical protein [Nitrospiraceae bacterium]